MKFLFIDEVNGDAFGKTAFAVGGVLLDSVHYLTLRKTITVGLKNLSWTDTQFKGRYVFSQKAKNEISIEARKGFIKSIVTATKSGSNSRIKFFYALEDQKRSPELHKELLKRILKKLVPPAKQGEKSLLGIYIDQETSLGGHDDVYNLVISSLNKKWSVFERPFLVSSDKNTHGLLLVDILLYVKLVQHLRENLTTSHGHEIEKYQYTKELVDYVSKIEC